MSSFWKGAARILTLVLIVGVIGLIVIQFVPIERSNPAVVKEPAWDSSQTRALTKRACFDCHSNEIH